MEKKKIAIWLIFLFWFICLLFYLYNFDNKYVNVGEQPINGILDLRNSDRDYTFLIYDWEFYPDRLYTPDDFKDGVPDSYMEYISIGERTSMTGDLAHGKGTYRLTLILPEEEKTYGILMPEVFSAYDLYIDGSHALKLGDTENNKIEVQSRLVSFSASGKVPIVIDVASFSHFYSGIIYPPALGDTKALNGIRGVNVLLTIFIFSLSFICFLLSLYMGAALKHWNINLFTCISFLFCIYISHNIIHNYFSCSSELTYIIENVSYYLLFFVVLLLHSSICKIPIHIRVPMLITAGAVCIIALFANILSPDLTIGERQQIALVLEIYKWVCGIYITVSSILTAFRYKNESLSLLCGGSFFAVSLIFDRLYPLYEPIYGKYFIEIGLIALIVSLACLIWNDITTAYVFSLTFDEQQKQMTKQIEIHKNNYEYINKGTEEIRKARHDLRQHLRVIDKLASDGKNDDIRKYISILEKNTPQQTTTKFSDNSTVNAIMQYYSRLFQKYGIGLSYKFTAEVETDFPDTDITIIFGNLLENAAEACSEEKDGDKTVVMKGALTKQNLLFQITNTYDKPPIKTTDGFLSRKTGKPGVGIKSVRSVVEKYGGIIDIEFTDTTFTVSAEMSIGNK